MYEAFILVDHRDVHVANDQLSALGLHLSMLPRAVSGVVFEHVDLKRKTIKNKDLINNHLTGKEQFE